MPITLDGTTGIITPDLASGPVAGTTGTFSGAVQVSGITENLYPIVSGTPVASTSGTRIDFTGIPVWAKRVTVMFSGVSTNGTSNPLIQLGAGSIVSTGYRAYGIRLATSSVVTGAAYTAGFGVASILAANTINGSLTLSLLGSDIWVGNGGFADTNGSNGYFVAGAVTLSGTLDSVRVTTVGGTNTFDAGTINVMWE